jgi:DNA repair exonuclease SbcCD ATPase subunit
MDSNYAKLKDMVESQGLQVIKNKEKADGDVDQLRAEFEHHKSKDFKDCVDRVTELEKRLNKLTTIVNNLKVGGNEGPAGVDEARFMALVERVDRLEAELAALKDLFAQWQKNFQDDLNLKADKTAL